MIEDDDAAKRREKLQALREKRKQVDAGGGGSAPFAGAGQEGGRARLLKVLAERRRQGQGRGEGGGENRRQIFEQFPKLRELMAQRSQTVEHEPKPAADESSYRAQLEVRLSKLEATLDEILDYLKEKEKEKEKEKDERSREMRRPKGAPAAAAPHGAEVQAVNQEKSKDD